MNDDERSVKVLDKDRGVDEDHSVFDNVPSKDPSQEFAHYSYEYSAPLPPYQDFAEYENTLPGAADRILKLAEEQSKHRQYLEVQRQEFELEQLRAVRHQFVEETREDGLLARRGQTCAMLSVFVLAIVAATALMLGFEDAASQIILGGLVAVVGIFVTGKYFATKETESESYEQEISGP